MQSRTVQRGVTMVESLVALVVLSVGMLGIASLHIASLKTGRTALTRTQAVNLVNDMADRIRANPSARGDYDTADLGGDPEEQDCVVTDNCSAQELAEDDLARWFAAVADTLPGGATGVVDFTERAVANGPDRYRIRVTWREAGEEQDFFYETNVNFIPVAP